MLVLLTLLASAIHLSRHEIAHAANIISRSVQGSVPTVVPRPDSGSVPCSLSSSQRTVSLLTAAIEVELSLFQDVTAEPLAACYRSSGALCASPIPLELACRKKCML